MAARHLQISRLQSHVVALHCASHHGGVALLPCAPWLVSFLPDTVESKGRTTYNKVFFLINGGCEMKSMNM
ncbi:hypothetical protein PIB30_041710 [Stylosanthes scabra]|uniref:Secreted protein n=1 Tax=Stylosanthes scabra TaxID=79078 RepID=A0ABU6WD41_9FABA|nr:hypothetical protein [Stylosanthes scabra]